MNTKQCNTCRKIKSLDQFGINRKANSNNFHASQITQYKSDCKSCLSIKAKAYRDANPGLWKKYQSNEGKLKSYPKKDRLLLSAIRMRVTDAKARAKKRNQTITITVDFMYQLFKQQNGQCALSNTQLAIQKQIPTSLSIDKKDPLLGYSEDNVQWVCWAVNRAKGDLTMRTFIDMCKRITEKCRDYP